MNKKINKNNKATDFGEYLKGQLKNKEFKKYYDEYGKQLEIAYKIAQLRKKAKMSQNELAKKIGTTQSNIARMESGRQNFTIGMLSRVVNVFDKELAVCIN